MRRPKIRRQYNNQQQYDSTATRIIDINFNRKIPGGINAISEHAKSGGNTKIKSNDSIATKQQTSTLNTDTQRQINQLNTHRTIWNSIYIFQKAEIEAHSPVIRSNPEVSCFKKTTLFPLNLPVKMINTVPGVMLALQTNYNTEQNQSTRIQKP